MGKYSEQELLEHAKENTRWLREVLRDDVKIGFENNNYYPTPAYDIVSDGVFITKLINQTNLYLLLDIAHAMVTAHNKNTTYQDYIASLPLENLIQLHICQPLLPDEETAQDVHNEPNAEMLEEVIRLSVEYQQIKYLTIEFYKDKKALIRSIRNLKNRL